MDSEERLAEILGEWYERRDRGEAIDPEDVIEAHPDLAERLRARFGALDFVDMALADSLPRTVEDPQTIGAYRIRGELGSGGMGRVYLAETTAKVAGLDVGTRVAMKVVHPHLLERAGFFKRFLREAHVGQSVEHVNVVRTLDCDAVRQDREDHHFLVMEYVEGQTLAQLLQELERVPEELCRHIGREVARGLAAIHEAGVVHRDLKPENVLITESQVVKVMDLGVARIQDEVIRLSQTGAFVGSLEYASPEQFRRRGDDIDGRTDLHALGLMLYELSTGQHPYRDEAAAVVIRNIVDETPRRAGEANPQLSPFFEEVVHTLIAKEREQRFPSASDLASVLDEGEKSEWWKERAKALRLETKRPLRRIRIPRETALYGREDDLARLHALYERASAGDGQVVLIEGEAGIGKTRLVDEFVGRLRQEGEDLNFLFGSYPPGGAATAAGAFSTAFREHFGSEGLEETLKDHLKSTPALAPAFAALLRGETTPEGAEALTQDSVQTVFVHATRSIAAERTTVVLIDDLHFSPAEGRSLFSAHAMAVPDHSILLIGTMRPGVPDGWTANITRLEQAQQMSLARLGPKDLAALLHDVFRSERLAEELGWKIARKSDGNPFFAFEIVRGLKEGQLIRQHPDGSWHTTQRIEDIQVPSSILDLVNARVSGLTRDERNLLDVAACWGYDFDPTLVGEVVGLRRIEVLRNLAQIERAHRLVRSAGRHYTFDHHQVQEALYQSLNEVLREEYHAALAEALEVRVDSLRGDPGDIEGRVCAQLVTQFVHGARPASAVRYLEGAVRHLQRTGAPASAAGLARSLLDAEGVLVGPERAQAILLFTSAAQPCGRYEEAVQASREAMDLAVQARDEDLELGACLSLANCLHPLARHDEGEVALERALVLARRRGNRSCEGRALASLGNVMDASGRYDRALELHRASLEIAEEHGEAKTEITELGHIAGVLWSQGRFEEAQELSARHLRRATEVGDPVDIGLANNIAGNLAWVRADLEAAAAHYREALTCARVAGFRRLEAVAVGNLGSVLHSDGKATEAESAFHRQAEISGEIGYSRGVALAEGNLGANAMLRGDLAAALPRLQASVSRLRVDRCERELHGALIPFAEVLLLLGDRERAAEAAREAVDVARTLGLRTLQLAAEVTLADAAPEADRAAAELRSLRERAWEAGEDEVLASATWRLARRLVAAGDGDATRDILQETLAKVGSTCSPQSHMRVLALLARIDPGHVTEAEEARAQHGSGIHPADRLEYEFRLFEATRDVTRLSTARTLLDQLVEHAPPEYGASMLVDVPLHREIMEAWAEHGRPVEDGGTRAL